jgi:hypothetical protein
MATVPSKRKLVGCANFVRSNPLSDAFECEKFDHIEFWCGDATNAAARFGVGLGMGLRCKSDASTGERDVRVVRDEVERSDVRVHRTVRSRERR